MSNAPASLAVIASRVEDRLRCFLAGEAARWASISTALEPPMASLRNLVLNGGKRLRPAFCYWGYIAAGGGQPDDCVIAAGAAFELLHAFALVHDDVMDGSAIRRGERTAHLSFADRHEAGRWSGEARRFGEGVAFGFEPFA